MQYRPNEACDTSINWLETLWHQPWDSSSTASREFTTIIMKLNDKEFQMYILVFVCVWLCICIQSNACKLYQRQKTERVCVCVCVCVCMCVCVCVCMCTEPPCLPEWGQSPLPSSPLAATWMRSIHPPAGRQSFAAIRCRHGDRASVSTAPATFSSAQSRL